MFSHLSAVWSARHFLLALVKLDLRLRYRRSVLGVGWSLLHPIAMTAVFTVVFSQLFGDGNPVGYAAFALAGLAVWSFLRDATTAGSRAFLANEAYIRQSPMPYIVYTLRTVLGQVIHTCLALSVVVTLVVVWKWDLGALVGVLLALPGLLLAVIAAWAVATIGAFVSAFFHDTTQLLDVGCQIGFYLTPIMYRRSVLDDRGLGWMVDINPANVYLAVTRDPLLAGIPSADGMAQLGQAYLAAFVLTLTLVGLAAFVVSWLHKKVIFHL
ncbi:ABC transporter permease [Frigoriglobus tundricola]|uniref:O-antigen export system permease protein RfbD n=1 Tax=Frigoriglobus tundricola TaxID=2774151 RepID=A0A6M5Z652_9BACT|nr:ABC transporter permease [Frigoriglobus tundricola]QJX00894.1 O-antigen export system permease protein RfbD [Frigoriglobus tundricola]